MDVMMDVKTTSFNEDAPISEKDKNRLDVSDKNDLRIEITNKLKRENPDLEELL
jgi:hypothetical protein